MAGRERFRDPKVLVAAGTGLAALAAVVGVGVMLSARPHAAKPAGAPGGAAGAGQDHGALQVQMNGGDDKLDPAKPLRCFVNGQFVGQATLAQCAARNGVSAQNLDVGLDPSGQVAAQGGAAAPLAPLPQPDASAGGASASDLSRQTPTASLDADGASRSGGAPCLRFAGGGWRPSGEGLSLKACVHALYDDRCVHMGDALYGRYGQQTLRLVPGRVEISGDNRNFRPLVPQDPDACTLQD